MKTIHTERKDPAHSYKLCKKRGGAMGVSRLLICNIMCKSTMVRWGHSVRNILSSINLSYSIVKFLQKSFQHPKFFILYLRTSDLHRISYVVYAVRFLFRNASRSRPHGIYIADHLSYSESLLGSTVGSFLHASFRSS